MTKLVPNHSINFQPGPDYTPAALRERAQRALLYADTLFYPDTFGRNAAAERLRSYAADLEARAAALSLFNDALREALGKSNDEAGGCLERSGTRRN